MLPSLTVGNLPVPRQAPAQIRAQARRILAGAEFRPARQSWWSAAISWVLRHIGQLLGRLLGLGGGSGVGAWVAVGVLVVVLVVVGVLAVRFWVRLPADPTRQVVGVVVTGPRSAVDWRAEAARHEREGRWRDALRCRYRALVAELAWRGLVEEVPGRTAGEYRALLGARAPAVSGDFTGATDLFEGAWYGDRSTGPSDQATFDELAGRVLTTVSSEPSER